MSDTHRIAIGVFLVAVMLGLNGLSLAIGIYGIGRLLERIRESIDDLRRQLRED